jgi:hypothetical protein
MERAPHETPRNHLRVLDNLIAEHEFAQPLHDAVWQAVNASESLSPQEQYETLLQVHDKAYHMDYRLRAGVQSSILDRAMQVPGVEASTPIKLQLHLMQVEALIQDVAILRPGFYLQSELVHRVPNTVAKLHEHGNAALEIMKHRPYRKHPGRVRCKVVMRMVPLSYQPEN